MKKQGIYFHASNITTTNVSRFQMERSVQVQPALLAFRDVSMTYARWFSKPKQALRGVSVEVRHGEVVGLLGPNGAGKSTLMRIACGLVWPGAGTAAVMGKHPGRHVEVRRHIGAMLESDRWMVWQLTGRENLDYFACMRGITDKRQRLKRVDESLELVGLSEAARRAVGEYSRGMKQRLGIAGALLTEPALLLLDEPTLGLDLEGQALIRQLLTRLAAEGRGILLATHQLELAARYAHRIAFLREGQLVVDMPVPALLERYAPVEFEIVVRGDLGPATREYLVLDAGCRVEQVDGDTWLIRCPPAVAASPYALLDWLGGRGLSLVRAGQTAPDLEVVYERIMREAGQCSGGRSVPQNSGVAG
jgi:ABC-2 type transport system ATP-binding protein